jgi:copper homeostasis protein
VHGVLEICTDRLDDIPLAMSSGADRIELCSALSLGGLTPSAGAMRLAAAAGVPIVALIRPREGDFVFSTVEASAMRDDITSARAAGMSGVAIGALTRDGRLDTGLLTDLVAAAAPLPVTLHRAFDLTPDPYEALEKAIELGVARVLTSGQKPAAPQGAALIAALI